MVERRTVKVGDFIKSGPPASGASLTKVRVIESAEDIEAADQHFDRMVEAIAMTKRALAALRGKAQ